MTPYDPMDYSLPVSSIHGIFQARALEWVAISFSTGLPNPGIEPSSPTLLADSLQFEPPLTCSLSTKSRPEIHPGFAGQEPP